MKFDQDSTVVRVRAGGTATEFTVKRWQRMILHTARDKCVIICKLPTVKYRVE